MQLRNALIVNPHLYIGDVTGRPLDNGYVYFGEANKNPELYPINIYFDDALTIPAENPIRTKGGFLYYAGNIVSVFASQNQYSVKVVDKYGRQVFYTPNLSGVNSDAGVLMADGSTLRDFVGNIPTVAASIADMLAIRNPKHGQIVYLNRFGNASSSPSDLTYFFDATSTDDDNGFETLAVNGVTGRWKMLIVNKIINAVDVGYVGDGITANDDIHQKVSAFLNKQTEHYELLFNDGDFLFNNPNKSFKLVSGVTYNIKPTAKIIGGSALDNIACIFSQQYDTTRPLVNTTLTGGGTIDLSNTGYMRSSYLSRGAFYLLNPINFNVNNLTFKGGDFSQLFITGETQYINTSKDVYFENNTFIAAVADKTDSKNTDHTTIYSQAKNTVVRNNTFIANNIRSRCLSTAMEFHTDDGEFSNNNFVEYNLGVYIAQMEQLTTNNIRVKNNTGTLGYAFVCYYTKENSDGRTANDNFITGNTITQSNYPTQSERDTYHVGWYDPTLKFIMFQVDKGNSGSRLSSNNITVSGNTFTHKNLTSSFSTLIALYSEMPANVNINHNNLNVASIIYCYTRVPQIINNLNISKNVINSKYLSLYSSPLSLNVDGLRNCLIDLSDIQYVDLTQRNVQLVSFANSTGDYSLTKIIEGKQSYRFYKQSVYPTNYFRISQANQFALVAKTFLSVAPQAASGAAMSYIDLPNYDACTAAEVISCDVKQDPTFILPAQYNKKFGDAAAFVGIGFSDKADAKTIDAYVYIT